MQVRLVDSIQEVREEHHPEDDDRFSEETPQNQSLSTATNTTMSFTSNNSSSMTSSTVSRPNYLIKSGKPSVLAAQISLSNPPVTLPPIRESTVMSPVPYEPIPDHLNPVNMSKRMNAFRDRLKSLFTLMADIEKQQADDIALYMQGEDEYINCEDDDICY